MIVHTSLNGGQFTINLSLTIAPSDVLCSSSGCSSNVNIGAAATSHARTVTARDMGTMTEEVWCSDNLARSERGGGSRALAVGAKQRGKDADSQATTDTQGSPTRGCDELQVTRTGEGSQDTAAGEDSQAKIMPEEDSQVSTTGAASQEVTPLQPSSPSTPRRRSNTPTELCGQWTPPPTNTPSPQSPVLSSAVRFGNFELGSCARAPSPAVPRVASSVAAATLGVSSAAIVGGSRAASPADGPLDVGPTTAVPVASAGGGLAVAQTACNLMQLLQDPTFCAQKNEQLCKDVSLNKRDALDLAGKLPLALKALTMGISPHELNIDPAQAGGLLGKFDAVVKGSSSLSAPTASSIFSVASASSSAAGEEGIEVKGARSYRGKQTFQFSRMRPGTPFQHILLVARRQDPTNWTDMRQLDQLFWLGHVRRSDFDQAVAKRDVTGGTGNASIQPPPRRTGELTASVTIGSRRRSWFGEIVTWVPFHKLDKAWWDANVRNTK
jgi:hypothetical protein